VANPQAEDGHTDIANDVLEALARIRIPGEARQVLDVILRKTWGWKKRSDDIPLSQFCLMTGMPKDKVVRARIKLEAMNIVVSKKGNGLARTYRFNKNFETWKPLPKKEIVSQKGNLRFPKRKSPSPPLPSPKETLQKKERKRIADALILFLNETGGRTFELNDTNRKNIMARLKEGVSEEECRTVITYKFDDQFFKDNPENFNPITLFRTSKFSKYRQAAKLPREKTEEQKMQEWLNS
jgi:phage replication O-like protein O